MVLINKNLLDLGQPNRYVRGLVYPNPSVEDIPVQPQMTGAKCSVCYINFSFRQIMLAFATRWLTNFIKYSNGSLISSHTCM